MESNTVIIMILLFKQNSFINCKSLLSLLCLTRNLKHGSVIKKDVLQGVGNKNSLIDNNKSITC
jgi:hypothetical protein